MVIRITSEVRWFNQRLQGSSKASKRDATMKHAILVALSLAASIGCHKKADAPKTHESQTAVKPVEAKPAAAATASPSGWSTVELSTLPAPDPSEAMDGTIAPHAPWNQKLALPPNATAVRKVTSDKYEPTGTESIEITAGKVQLSFDTNK